MGDISEGYDHPLWYAAYTASRHEKQVGRHLQDRGLEHLLPVFDTIHRWKNGRHRVQMPLFPGYIFVHIALRDRMRVLGVPGLLRLVGFGNLPCPIPDEDIQVVRAAMIESVGVLPHRYLTTGSRVEICHGPLRGLRGILLRGSGKYRVVLSVDLIMRSIVVEIDIDSVRRLAVSSPCSQGTMNIALLKDCTPPPELTSSRLISV